MTSRSDTMPTISLPATTGKAPIRLAPSLWTASMTRSSAVIVSTSLPLLRSTSAMVMAVLPDSPLGGLIVPLRAAKGKPNAPARSDSSTTQCLDAPLLADLPAAGPAFGRRGSDCRPVRHPGRTDPDPRNHRDGARSRPHGPARHRIDDARLPQRRERV